MTEREPPLLPFVVGVANVLLEVALDPEALAREPRLVPERAARAPLAGEAVADRDPNGIALDGDAELTAAAVASRLMRSILALTAGRTVPHSWPGGELGFER